MFDNSIYHTSAHKMLLTTVVVVDNRTSVLVLKTHVIDLLTKAKVATKI